MNVVYCPECGTIKGEFGYRSRCCPDSQKARSVSVAIAEQARAGFLARIYGVEPNGQGFFTEREKPEGTAE